MMAENKTTGTHVQAQETPQAEKKLQVHNLRISFRTAAGKVQAVRGISFDLDRKSTRLNSSHRSLSRMPSSA